MTSDLSGFELPLKPPRWEYLGRILRRPSLRNGVFFMGTPGTRGQTGLITRKLLIIMNKYFRHLSPTFRKVSPTLCEIWGQIYPNTAFFWSFDVTTARKPHF